MAARPETAERGGRPGLLLGLLLGIAVVIFLAGLGRLPLFGRDEALYAEAAREMLAGRDWITPRVNGALFFEKPPLYYWLAMVSYSIFGVSPFAARLPAALAGIVTVFLTFFITSRTWGRRAGLFAGLALATSLQMAMIGRMGIMDVPLTCLVTGALLAYARWRRHGRPQAAAAFGVLTGLGFLLKGLAGGLAPAIAVLHAVLYRRGSGRISARLVLLSLGAFLIVAGPWFAAVIARHGEEFIDIFVRQQHGQRMTQQMQSHGGPVFYYVALIAVSFFPWIAFVPSGLAAREGEEKLAFWRSLLLLWMGAVLVPFSLVSTKLPGYVTPMFPAMAILVGVELERRLDRPGRGAWMAALVGSVVLGAAFSLLPLAGARLGARVGASAEAWALVVPTACWVGGYAVIAVGGGQGLAGQTRRGLELMAAGQAIAVGALLIGILPVLSPFLGGGPAALAAVAERELPGSRVVLYDTHPEAVAFVLKHPVPTYGRNSQGELRRELEAGPTALIAPAKASEVWKQLPYRRMWRRGSEVLLEVPRLAGEVELGSSGAETRSGSGQSEVIRRAA